MSELQIFNIANMSFKAFPEIKFLQIFPNLQFAIGTKISSAV